MKTLLVLTAMIFSFSVTAKEIPLTIKWTFTNIETGYDHSNKIKVYVDDEFKGESESFSQSVFGRFDLKLTEGKHTVKIVNYALYEGKWEEHTVANEYSVDAFLMQTVDITKPSELSVTWDLGGSETIVKLSSGKAKREKKKKGKEVTLTIDWQFTGIVEGYDHENRISVYVDDKLVGTSEEVKQSETGKFQVKVPKGKHQIRLEDYAFYEGKWEIHTKENEYSVDAYVNTAMDFDKNKTISILFDIDNEKTTFEVN